MLYTYCNRQLVEGEGLLSLNNLPNITEIRQSGFRNFIRLKEITLPNTITKIGNTAFQHNTNMEKIGIIPSSVTSIGSYAFQDCPRLTQVSFGENSQLKTLNSYAFKDCFALTEITFPEGVAIITDGLVCNCKNLQKVTFLGSVEKIKSTAFQCAEKLNAVSLTVDFSKCKGIPKLDTDDPAGVFSGHAAVTIIVPEGQVESWSTAEGWENVQATFTDSTTQE